MPISNLALPVALIAAFLGSPTDARASYKLESGAKYSLCRDFLKNLQTFPERTVAFEWPFDSKLKHFTRPKWQHVDAKSRLDIIEKIYEGLWYRRPDYRALSEDERAHFWPEKLRPKVLEEIDAGLAKLETARLDANNDGKAETAFRYGRRVHDVHENFGTPQGNRVLWGWWYWLGDDDEGVSNGWRLLLSLGVYDLFFYKGRTYLGTLSVNDIFSVKIGRTVPDYLIHEPLKTGTRENIALIPVCLFVDPDRRFISR